MAAPVRVDGARQLRASLKRAGVALDDLKEANAKVAAYVAQLANARAPRRTGRLAATLRGNRAAGRARVSAGTAAIPYAGPIHWGWEARNIDPQPWITEAAQDSQTVWLAQYSAELDNIVSQIEGARP